MTMKKSATNATSATIEDQGEIVEHSLAGVEAWRGG